MVSFSPELVHLVTDASIAKYQTWDAFKTALVEFEKVGASN